MLSILKQHVNLEDLTALLEEFPVAAEHAEKIAALAVTTKLDDLQIDSKTLGKVEDKVANDRLQFVQALRSGCSEMCDAEVRSTCHRNSSVSKWVRTHGREFTGSVGTIGY